MLGAATPTGWVDVSTTGKIQRGLRYTVGIVAPAGWTTTIATGFFAPDFTVGVLQPGQVTGGLSSWVMQGVARQDGQLANTPYVNYASILEQVPTPVPAPAAMGTPEAGAPAPAPGTAPAAASPPSASSSVGIWLLALAAAGAAGWFAYRNLSERPFGRARPYQRVFS